MDVTVFFARMQDASSGAADRKFPRDQLYFQASIMAQWKKKGEYSEYSEYLMCKCFKSIGFDKN